MTSRRTWTVVLLLGLSLLLAGCVGGRAKPSYRVQMTGNPRHGKQLVVSKGCGSCHLIPGIYTARGMVGPPLIYFSRRTMIAGELPNTPDNLVRWIRDPKAVEPGTAMPDLGLTNEEAHDVAAYLYTLR